MLGRHWKGFLVLRTLGVLAAMLLPYCGASAGRMIDDGGLSEGSDLAVQSQLMAVQTAIESGLLQIAQDLINRVPVERLTPAQQAGLLNQRLRIALAAGQSERVVALLGSFREMGFAPEPLLAALAEFFTGDREAAIAAATDLFASTDEAHDAAWLAFMRALLYQQSDDLEAANDWFQRAERLAPGAFLRDHFEIVRIRGELSRGRVSPEAISALRETARSMRGERAGFEAARLLAVALNLRGETEEALTVLNAQLAEGGLREFGLRADFLLLVGFIAGADSARGQLALRQLINEDASPELQSLALTLLLQWAESSGQAQALIRDLSAWLEASPSRVLADRMQANLAWLFALTGQPDRAEETARAMLQQFPASAHGQLALRVLAYVAWSRNPPQYRSAAEFLNQLRQRMDDGLEKHRVTALIGDCFFLNADFSSAADAYAAAARFLPAHEAGPVFFRRVIAEIRAGRANSAAALLDEAYAEARIEPVYLWQAEWNLVLAMRRNGLTVDAFRRLRSLLGAFPGMLPAHQELNLRWRWLEARLLLEQGQFAAAIQAASDLRAAIHAGDFNDLAEDLLGLLQSHLLLLLGEAHLSAGQSSEATKAFSQLRSDFPSSAPAILSYLLESRSAAAGDSLVDAQRSLIDLVNRFPDSEFAPLALWEAALHAEQRGLNVHLQEAISTLERLVEAYPTHPLVFFARLKQGDLARRLNDFSTALLLYERAINQFPEHQERFRAELNRADTLAALAAENPARLDTATAIYERNTLLASVPPASRMEAGYKWARTLQRQNDTAGHAATLWFVFTNLLDNPNLSPRILMSEAGRYWAARTMVDLADFLDNSGELSRARVIRQLHVDWQLPGAEQARSRLIAND